MRAMNVTFCAVPAVLPALCLALLGACGGHEDRVRHQAPRDVDTARVLSIRVAASPDHGIVSLSAGGEAGPEWLFRAPPGGEVRQFSLARDESTLVYSYVPPPDGEGVELLDRSALYRVDPTASSWTPERLLGGDTPGEFLLEPALSPDGRYCWFVRVAPSQDEFSAWTDVSLRRLDMHTGEVLHVIDNGIWPTVSPDGRRIAFVGVQPLSQQRGLFVADGDGGNLRMVVEVGRFFDVDAPVFSPDGRHVVFAVAEEDTRPAAGRRLSGPTPSSPRRRNVGAPWWLRLLPVASARAHNDHDVPSDWWRVPAAGGKAERLTRAQRIMSYGAFADGGERFAYATTGGIFLTDFASPGGEERVLQQDGAWMSLAWLGGRAP